MQKNKKNILLIVLDSITNDILFNKENSNQIAPYLNSLRKKSISGDKMYSEAPYTEAALMSLLGSVDTMDNGGYMERMKNTKSVLEVFKENDYKVFFNNYYPSIYPSYMVKGYDNRRYIEGFQFEQLWEYRLKYFSNIDNITSSERKMLIDMLEDNLICWLEYLEKIKNKDIETTMLNDCINTDNIDEDINKLKKEIVKFNSSKSSYLDSLLKEKENHALFKIKTYKMTDKVNDNNIRNKVIEKHSKTFKRIYKLNIKKNFINNKLPLMKTIKSLLNLDFKNAKSLIAGYKNSLFDKDLYERINNNYDLFKNQRSFHTVSEELFKWIKDNKENNWMSYVHIDDSHYNENFFTYDTSNLKQIDEEFLRINKYLDNLPKKYKGSITYDLSLMYCDNIIKNIFKFLEKEKLLENTAVVITADHGFSYYFSPVREKYVISSYKENYNVPFIIYSKDIKKRTISNFCATKDIPSTLLDLAKIKVPKEFKGKSLLSFEGREYSLLEYMGGGCPDIKRRPINLGVRTDNYSVVLNVYINKKFEDRELIEVYNLKKDRNEHNNLKNKKNINKQIQKELEILEKRFLVLKKQYKDSDKDD